MVYSLEHYSCYTYNTNFDYKLASRMHPVFYYQDTTYELLSSEYGGCITVGIKVQDMVTKEISVEGKLISVSMEMADEPIIFCLYRDSLGNTYALCASILGEDRDYETHQLSEEFRYSFVYAQGERLVLTSRGVYRMSSETFVSFFDEIGSVTLMQYSGDNDCFYICNNTVDHKTMLYQLKIENDRCIVKNKLEMEIYFKKFVIKNNKMFAEALSDGENIILYSPNIFEKKLQFVLSGASNIKDMGKVTFECDDGTFIEVEEYGDDYEVKFKKMSIDIMPMYMFSSEDKASIRNVMMTECRIYKDNELSDDIDNITIYTDEYSSLIINDKVYFVDSGKPITVPITCGYFTILEEVFDDIAGCSYTIEFGGTKEVIDPNEKVLNEIKTIKEEDLKDFSIADDKEKCKSFLDAIDILNEEESMTKDGNSLDDCFYFVLNDDGTYESGRGIIKRRNAVLDGLKSIWNSIKKFTSAVYHGVAKITYFVKEKMNIIIDYIVDGIRYTIKWICDTAQKLMHSFLAYISRLGNIIVDIGKFLCRLFNIGDVFRNAKEIERSINSNLELLINQFNNSETRSNWKQNINNEIYKIENKKNETVSYLEKERENVIKQETVNEESDRLSQNNYVAYSLISENKKKSIGSIFEKMFKKFMDSLMSKCLFIGDYEGVFDNFFNKIKDAFTKGNVINNVLNTFCEAIRELIDVVLNVSKQLFQIAIDLIGSILSDLRDVINMEIPIISSICKYLGLGKITWLSVISLAASIPYTILTKIKKMTRSVVTSCIVLSIQVVGGVFKIGSFLPQNEAIKPFAASADLIMTISMFVDSCIPYKKTSMGDALLSMLACIVHHALDTLRMFSHPPVDNVEFNPLVKTVKIVSAFASIGFSIGITIASIVNCEPFTTVPNTIILCARGIISEVIENFFKDSLTTRKIMLGAEVAQIVSGTITLVISTNL